MYIVAFASAQICPVVFERLFGRAFANASCAVAYLKFAAASRAVQKEIAFARLLEGIFGFGFVGTTKIKCAKVVVDGAYYQYAAYAIRTLKGKLCGFFLGVDAGHYAHTIVQFVIGSRQRGVNQETNPFVGNVGIGRFAIASCKRTKQEK